MTVIVKPTLFIVPLPLEPDRLGDVAYGALIFDRCPVVGFGEPAGVAVGGDQLHRRAQGVGDIGTEHLALLGVVDTQHGHKTARLVDHSALVVGFFADDTMEGSEKPSLTARWIGLTCLQPLFYTQKLKKPHNQKPIKIKNMIARITSCSPLFI